MPPAEWPCSLHDVEKPVQFARALPFDLSWRLHNIQHSAPITAAHSFFGLAPVQSLIIPPKPAWPSDLSR